MYAVGIVRTLDGFMFIRQHAAGFTLAADNIAPSTLGASRILGIAYRQHFLVCSFLDCTDLHIANADDWSGNSNTDVHVHPHHSSIAAKNAHRMANASQSPMAIVCLACSL